MAFRDSFLKKQGLSACHSEAMLYTLDVELIRDRAVELLLVGVGNGGTLEILQEVLSQDSVVGGVDCNILCEELKLPIRIIDPCDILKVRQLLAGAWFDIIIDCSHENGLPHLWPYLKQGGKFIVEKPQRWMIDSLVQAFPYGDGWLPGEEVLRIGLYPDALVIEKRTPRVVPYLDVIVGTQFPIVPLEQLVTAGARQLSIEETTT